MWKNSSGTPVNTLTYSFDDQGNMTLAKDKNGAYTFTYDALNRVSTVKEPFSVTLTFTYDAANNRTKMQDSLGATTTSIFDALNRLQTREVTSSSTTVRVDRTYNSRGPVETDNRYSHNPGGTMPGPATHTYAST